MTDDLWKSLRASISQANAIAEQVKALTNVGSLHAETISAANAMQSLAMPSVVEQYKGLWGADSELERSIRVWQDVGRSQFEQAEKLIREQTALFDTAAKMAADQSLAWHSSSSMLAEQLTTESAVQRYLRDFERVNKQWQVPNDLLGLVGSFKTIHEHIGKVSLPTIDFTAASALVAVLGKQGIEGQLALLGIELDGTMRPTEEQPDKGILSRKHSDAMTLISLLLALLIPLYQEILSRQQKADDDTYKVEMRTAMEVQFQQIGHLTTLIEQTLVAAANEPKDRLIVRARIAKVRVEPKHGSSIAGELLPNEVVYPVVQQGKWVEVEYYHWLHEGWQTGWVLKKYLERVPASYSESRKEGK